MYYLFGLHSFFYFLKEIMAASHSREMLDLLPEALRREAGRICALNSPGPYCLPTHIDDASPSALDDDALNRRALAVIAYVMFNDPAMLRKEANVKMAQEFLTIAAPRGGDFSFLLRSERCVCHRARGFAVERGLVRRDPVLTVMRGASPAGEFPLREIFDFLEGKAWRLATIGEGGVLTDAGVDALNRASQPGEVRYPEYRRGKQTQYRYVEAALGRITSAVGPGERVTGRVCFGGDEREPWIEVVSRGASGAVYQFTEPPGRLGFMGDTPEAFGRSLVNFLALSNQGMRDAFPTSSRARSDVWSALRQLAEGGGRKRARGAPSEGRGANSEGRGASSEGRGANSEGRGANSSAAQTDELLAVVRPENVSSQGPWVKLALKDALRTACKEVHIARMARESQGSPPEESPPEEPRESPHGLSPSAAAAADRKAPRGRLGPKPPHESMTADWIRCDEIAALLKSKR